MITPAAAQIAVALPGNNRAGLGRTQVTKLAAARAPGDRRTRQRPDAFTDTDARILAGLASHAALAMDLKR